MYEFRIYLFDNCIISTKQQDHTLWAGTQTADANNNFEYNLKLFFTWLHFCPNIFNFTTTYGTVTQFTEMVKMLLSFICSYVYLGFYALRARWDLPTGKLRYKHSRGSYRFKFILTLPNFNLIVTQVENCLAQSIAAVLVTKQFQKVGLVHIIHYELRHEKDIVSYKLRGLEIFLNLISQNMWKMGIHHNWED